MIDVADRQFTAAVIVITLGIPLVVYLWGNPTAMFYTHVALGAFWFGLDFFFKFVLGPALDAAPSDAAGRVNQHLVPKIVVVAEPLSVGVIGSGIGLAHLLGLWADPSIWLWGALAIGILMLVNGFGPLHVITTRLTVELSSEDPDGDRVEELFGKAMQWGLIQTVFMLAILLMMVGLRGINL